MSGWIKTYRKIQENWIWTSREPYDMRSAWQYLLMNANYSESKILTGKGELIEIKRGQIFVSVRTLSEKWKWSVSKVSRFLKRLEDEKMVQRIGNKSGTLLTIVNYGFYQGCENTENTINDTEKIQSKDDKDTIKEQQKDNQQNNEDTITDTIKIQSANDIKESNKDKEYKELKKEKEREESNNIIPLLIPPQGECENEGKPDESAKKKKPQEVKHHYGEYQNVLLTDTELDKLYNDYGEYETHEAIKVLDEGIEMKGYKYKSCYLAMRKWAFREVEDRKKKRQEKKDINANKKTQLEYLLEEIRKGEEYEQSGNQ